MKRIELNNEYQIIGVDIGRGYSKAYTTFNNEIDSVIFKSLIGDSRNIDFSKYENPIYITTEGNGYFIGELAEKESYSATRNSSDSKTSLTVRVLISAIISRLAKCDNIKIMLGVPNNQYRKSVLLDIMSTYKDKTITVKDNLTNTSKTITITDIDIFKEGDSVAYDVMGHNINNDRDIACISLGFKTSEISYFSKGMNYVDRLSKTILYANQHMLGYVQNKLKDSNIIKDLNEIDSNINDYDELKREAYELASESFTQKIEEIIPNGFIETDVYLAGGTALHLTLDERFNIVEIPQLSVARGLEFVGRLLFE